VGREEAHAAVPVVAEHQLVVGIVEGDVPHAAELGPIGEAFELARQVGRGQRDPADDAGQERVLVGQVEEPPGLVEAVPSLHGDGRAHAARRQLLRELRWQEISLDGGHLVRHPGMLGGDVAPEVDVCVDGARRGGVRQVWR
jgi:hypothetical protein